MENENGHPFGDEWANREPMDPRQLRAAIAKWGEKQANMSKTQYKTCSQKKCVFHRSVNEEQTNGGCKYLPFMLDYPELRPKDGKCMRGCMPGKECIRYISLSERQLKKIIKQIEKKKQKEQKKQNVEPPKQKPPKPVKKDRRFLKWEAKNRERMELYKAGLNDYEIAKKTGSRHQAIYKWRKERNLPPNYDQTRPEEMKKKIEAIKDGIARRKGNEETIERERMELYKAGLSDNKIARHQRVAPTTIGEWRRRRNLPPNGRKKKDEQGKA